MPKQRQQYSDDEKALVDYLKQKLGERGVRKFPRDWHLKQLATAKVMLAGENAPTLDEWKACIDWAFADEWWKDKVDHLAVVERLWPKYVLKRPKVDPEKERRKRFIKSLYLS